MYVDMHCICEVLCLPRHSHDHLGRTGVSAHMSDWLYEGTCCLQDHVSRIYFINFVWKKISLPRKIKRDIIRKVHRYSCKTPVFLVKILIKLEPSRKIFDKQSYIKFHEHLSIVSRVVPSRWTDGRTDGQTDIRKLIFAFHNFANAPND